MKVRRGFHCYMAILTHLLETPTTTAGVTELLGTHSTRTCQLLNELRTLRLVRREACKDGLRGTTYTWFYGADSSINTQRNAAAKPRPQAIQFAVFFRALQQPVSVTRVAELMGVKRDVVNKHLYMARAQFGAFPIVAYSPNFGCHPTPLYRFAPGYADLVLAPKSDRQINAEARQRAKRRQQQREALMRRAANSSVFNLAAAMAA